MAGPGGRLLILDGLSPAGHLTARMPVELRGKAPYLRVLTMDAETYSSWYKRPYAAPQPAVTLSAGKYHIFRLKPFEVLVFDATPQ